MSIWVTVASPAENDLITVLVSRSTSTMALFSCKVTTTVAESGYRCQLRNGCENHKAFIELFFVSDSRGFITHQRCKAFFYRIRLTEMVTYSGSGSSGYTRPSKSISSTSVVVHLPGRLLEESIITSKPAGI